MTSLATPTHTIGAHAITLPCGTALQLLPQRALVVARCPDSAGGGCALPARQPPSAALGQPVPHGTTADNLARLDAVLAATGADHLVFLGDSPARTQRRCDALWQQLLPRASATPAAPGDDPGARQP